MLAGALPDASFTTVSLPPLRLAAHYSSPSLTVIVHSSHTTTETVMVRLQTPFFELMAQQPSKQPTTARHPVGLCRLTYGIPRFRSHETASFRRSYSRLPAVPPIRLATCSPESGSPHHTPATLPIAPNAKPTSRNSSIRSSFQSSDSRV